MVTKIQKEAKKAADKYLRDNAKRLRASSLYTAWMIEYEGYIDRAGYKFQGGQLVTK